MIYFRDFVSSSADIPNPDPLRRAQNQLNLGDILFSATKAFQLAFQTDRNLVLSALNDTSLSGALVPPPPQLIPNAKYTQVWASQTNFWYTTRCNMEAGGNLVIYDNQGAEIWTSGTDGYPGAFLRCQDDGNLLIVAPSGEVIKNSGTYGGTH